MFVSGRATSVVPIRAPLRHTARLAKNKQRFPDVRSHLHDAPKTPQVSMLQVVQVFTETAIDRRLDFFEPGLPANRVVFVRFVVFKELLNAQSVEVGLNARKTQVDPVQRAVDGELPFTIKCSHCASLCGALVRARSVLVAPGAPAWFYKCIWKRMQRKNSETSKKLQIFLRFFFTLSITEGGPSFAGFAKGGISKIFPPHTGRVIEECQGMA